MENSGYVVAVDLGSSNVALAVAERRPEGLKVAALVEMPCKGVNAGLIENIELVSQAIGAAKEEVQQQLGIRIMEAYAGISGQFVRCASHKDYVFTTDKLNGVSQADVDRLFDRMRNVQAPNDEIIMERIPQNYIADNTEVQNPVGSFCGKLTSTFNFILCAQAARQRLDLAMKRCGITLKGIYSNARVVPESILSPEEKEEGMAVVNIGGGVTDVAVYYHNVLRYVASIPLGGQAIDRDIRSQSISPKNIRQLKHEFGSALTELAPDTVIQLPGRTARETKSIPRRNLAAIIEARVRDIVEYVIQELKDSGYYAKLGCGIILTGGTAKLQHIAEHFHRATDMEVHVGIPVEGIAPESLDKVKSPQWATVMGLLLCGAQRGICSTPQLPEEEWTRHQQMLAEQRAREEVARQLAEAEQKKKEAEEEAERQRLMNQLAQLNGGAQAEPQPAQPHPAQPAHPAAPKVPTPQPVHPVQPVHHPAAPGQHPAHPVQPVQPAQPVQPRTISTPRPEPVHPVQPVQPHPVQPKTPPVPPAEPGPEPQVEPAPRTNGGQDEEGERESGGKAHRNWKDFFRRKIDDLNEMFVQVKNDDEEI